ncbi:hypothetical protein DFH08DRAFT_331750 [Mycena albidolilacea]|uniref:Uncharacterized protein n=1 Tax=Mycena albidolilacea TaxID=1033008 RepID=A0AAD6ZLG9_9AGAR|nr:hypothetical protein DFH08DRAFT_331750 [Mycena albidolilacea]
MLALSTVFALLASSLAVDAAPGVQPSPDLGSVFSVYPGWDMDNGGTTSIFGGTEIDCRKACSPKAAVLPTRNVPYGVGNNGLPDCVLKNTVALNTFKTQSFDVSVGLVGFCGTFAPVGPSLCYTVPA